MALSTQSTYLSGTEKTDQMFRNGVIRIASRMESTYEQAIRGIFNNPFGLTPQQAVDALGTDAEDMFKFLAELRATLETYTPKTLTTVSDKGYSVSWVGDGTVTLSVIVNDSPASSSPGLGSP